MNKTGRPPQVDFDELDVYILVRIREGIIEQLGVGPQPGSIWGAEEEPDNIFLQFIITGPMYQNSFGRVVILAEYDDGLLSEISIEHVLNHCVLIRK